MLSAVKKFSGIFTAIVTPFRNDGSLDLDAFVKLIDKQIAAGVDGLVVCGSTGEGMTLSDEERGILVKKCVERVRGKVPVIAGAGHADTKVACALQKQMKENGADATLHVTPWYNKPTQDGLYQHFRQVALTNDLPVILYNVPSRTACDISVQTVLRLAQDCPTIVGLKESNIDSVRVQSMLFAMKKIRSDFSVLSGEDAFLLPLLAMGGQGAIAVCSNVAPRAVSEMTRAFRGGDLNQAQALADRLAGLIQLMFFRSNPIPVKSTLHLMGDVKNVFRLPLCPLNGEDLAYLRSNLHEGGWL